MEKKDSIYNHNITEQEMRRFGGWAAYEAIKKAGYDVYKEPDNLYYTLGIIYSIRGKKKEANKYFSKIEDKSMLQTLVQDF